MARAFLSHRIDFKAIEEVIGVWAVYLRLFDGSPIEVFSMAGRLAAERAGERSDREIVEACLKELRASELIIFDCSEPNWTYFGCVFEVVQGYSLGRPIYTYCGDNDYGARPWLRYHSRIVTDSHEALRLAVFADFGSA